MKAAGILDFATNLHNPDFAKMADAAHLLGLRAETAKQGATDDCASSGARRTRSGRSDRQSAGTLYAADDYSRVGEGLRDLHAQSGAQRARRRNRRSGEDQSLPVTRRKLIKRGRRKEIEE
jgi:hypothetical protein